MTEKSAILYQNTSKCVTLLDIPRSIATAQGTADNPGYGSLYSVSALEKPWVSTEPKTEKAKASVATHGMTSETNIVTDTLVQQALEELEVVWEGNWCLGRKLKHEQSPRRELQEPNLSAPAGSSTGWKALEPLILEKTRTKSLDTRDLQGRPVTNPSPRSELLLVTPATHHDTKSSQAPPSYYIIPPMSTFLLSPISPHNTAAFSMGALTLLPNPSSATLAGPGEFDFVLLDPPWSNRSARRSKSYETSIDPMTVLESTLGPHIALHGIVACWITNSATARAAAMQAFEAWDVELVEEWCWLKVTKDGRPVTEIRGVWRKPYEGLLIGRKQMASEDGGWQEELRKRVIVAVPDVHSRKPCVKGLVEEAFGLQEGRYRALEVFARNLTAGWWAWGDECLRFQWEGWWDSGDDLEEAQGENER